MRLSVALCTYNGEQYLPEQLASIRAQTRLPDEVIVGDDASSDATTAIVRDFAARAPFPVRLVVNARNLGSTSNFAQVISCCTGDVIALADQDDVWLPQKLAALEAALIANPEAGFAFSDAIVTAASLQPRGDTLWQAIRFYPREQQRFRDGDAFACLLRRYRVTGATLAFRAVQRARILPIPPEWHHDAWIALAIAAVAPAALVSEPLIRYRQHSGQQLGRPERGWYGKYQLARATNRTAYDLEVQRYRSLQERLAHDPCVNCDVRELVGRKLEHAVRRAEMQSSGTRRWPHVLHELWHGNYRRFSAGWKSMAQDLLARY